MEADTPTIVKASVPNPVIKGSFASPEAVAHVMVQKFVMGVPIYRQEKELERHGILLSRQTMSNWLMHSTEHWLVPIYWRLHQLLLERNIIMSDETEFQVLREPGRKAQLKSYLWVHRTGNDGLPPIILCDYQPGRGHEHPKRFLQGYTGYLCVDGWEAYRKIPDVTLVACWSHARRYYVDALKTLPLSAREDTDAMRGKRYCDRLFEIERELAELSPDERYIQRLVLAKPVLDEYFTWLTSFKDLGKSLFSRAVQYSVKQWQYLSNFLRDGRLELSNNRTERTIKMFVIDRKNFMFANTPRGADASAIIFSLIQTAIETGMNPFDYLVYVFQKAPNMDFRKHLDLIDCLLPHAVHDMLVTYKK